MIRQAIQTLAGLGPLPVSSAAAEDLGRLESYQELLERITRPVSDEEAAVLMGLLGPDECFGLAWALVHLVESAPGWPLVEELSKSDNEWIKLLRDRASRGCE